MQQNTNLTDFNHKRKLSQQDISQNTQAEQIYKVSVLKEKHVPNSAHAGDSC